jgi:transposase-like protein
MKQTRRKFTSSFKAKVAIEALQEKLTLHQLASKYEVHANQISQWKRQFLDNASSIFEQENKSREQQEALEAEQEKLYKKIGRLQVENDFLKKSLGE